MNTNHKESKLEQLFNREVRAIGGFSVKLAPTQKGLPDRLAILPGGVLKLVELKTVTGRRSPIQQYWHSRVEELGIDVATVSGYEGIKLWISEQLDEAWQRDNPEFDETKTWREASVRGGGK